MTKRRLVIFSLLKSAALTQSRLNYPSGVASRQVRGDDRFIDLRHSPVIARREGLKVLRSRTFPDTLAHGDIPPVGRLPGRPIGRALHQPEECAT